MKYQPYYEKNGNVSVMKESYVFLSGTVYPSGRPRIAVTEQCFCHDKHLGPNGACYPVALCGDCDLNKSGLCPQENQNLTIPGV